jgi:hypothetical protein
MYSWHITLMFVAAATTAHADASMPRGCHNFYQHLRSRCWDQSDPEVSTHLCTCGALSGDSEQLLLNCVRYGVQARSMKLAAEVDMTASSMHIE